VWSSVVRLTVRPAPAFQVGPRFAEVVAAAFAHRRKTLRNALQGLLTAADIEACGIDPGARPETIAPQGFGELGTAAAAATARQSAGGSPVVQ
jgi:16S rRNA (adenine1518-N6/adenine1519-N6)-dimethyltransferase